MTLRPLIQKRFVVPGGYMHLGFAEEGGDVSPGPIPERKLSKKDRRRLFKPLHQGKQPYPMTWGPPVKYVRIPRGGDGTLATLKVMKKLVLGKWGHRNPEVVLLAKKIASGVSPGPEKNYRAKAQAILDFMKSENMSSTAGPWNKAPMAKDKARHAGVDYQLDPAGLEWVQTPWYTLAVTGSGDCFVHGSRVLRREGHQLVPIESIRPGDEIWGLDRWSRVERAWEKGILPTYKVLLNNGSGMRFTPDHKVWVAVCRRHATWKGAPCSCSVADREVIVERVENLKPKDVVLQPSEIPFGSGEMDPDRAYVEGLYLSDGWSEETRFGISGQDGSPKEAQKRAVAEICAKLGLKTRLHRKHISVNDRDWAERMARMGKSAPFKRVLSLNLSELPARRLLEGIMADAGKNTNGSGCTFTTTSRELWLQTRVLLKMTGRTCSSRYIEDHGGLGRNPIHRLGVREQIRSDGKSMKLLRVEEVIRDGLELPCMDLTTDDHCVWLPEADWTVHQCDDQSVAAAALAMALGFRAGFRTVKGDPGRPDQWSHVYPVIGIPKKGKVIWLTADATQKESYLGWDPPEGKLYGMKTWVIDPGLEEASWDT